MDYDITDYDITDYDRIPNLEDTLVFEENPMRLRQWYVKDAQGYVTRVTLMDSAFGVDIPNDVFEIDHQAIIKPQ